MRPFGVLGIALGIALALIATPAAASSLPAVDVGDRPKLGAGFGTGMSWKPGGSIALDWPLMEGIAVGGSLSSTFLGGGTFDVRGTYRFVEGSRESPAIAAIVGMWGVMTPNGADPRFTLALPVAPSLGFGLAYSPLDRLMLRLNLAYSPFFTYGMETLGFIGGPPTSGIEAAYQVRPGMEVTLGLNGNGDILGLAYYF